MAFITKTTTFKANLKASSRFVKLNTAPAPKLNKPAISLTIAAISVAVSYTADPAWTTKYNPSAINNHLSIGQISAIKWAINNKTRIGNCNILKSRLVIKNIKSKFLITSFTGKVLTVDLQVLLSISLIPKCFALPIPFLYLSINAAVV